MSLLDWLLGLLPAHLRPRGPWGDRERPEMPEMHAAVNKQQALDLRIERLLRLEAQGRLDEWRRDQGRMSGGE